MRVTSAVAQLPPHPGPGWSLNFFSASIAVCRCLLWLHSSLIRPQIYRSDRITQYCSAFYISVDLDGKNPGRPAFITFHITTGLFIPLIPNAFVTTDNRSILFHLRSFVPGLLLLHAAALEIPTGKALLHATWGTLALFI